MVGQAMTNILKNAGEAIAARRLTTSKLKGRIVARLIQEEQGLHFPGRRQRGGACLPPGREQLTEPYVTTQAMKGTGLGLAIVKRIMEEHGGERQAAAGRRPVCPARAPPCVLRRPRPSNFPPSRARPLAEGKHGDRYRWLSTTRPISASWSRGS